MSPARFPGEGFSFHVLTQVPAPTEKEADGSTAGRLATAMRASHADLVRHADSAFVSAWVRTASSPALRVVVGGRPYFPPARGTGDGSERGVLFPVGALGRDLPESELIMALAELGSWTVCTTVPDALWGSTPGQAALPTRRGTFDRYGAHLRTPFAWLVHAQPVTQAEVDVELDQLVTEILPLSRSEVGEAARVELERKQARHRELSRARTAGAWRVRVVVGGEDPSSSATTAAMLCAATDLEGLPHLLLPGVTATSLEAALGATSVDLGGPTGSARAEVLAGPELLGALCRPPERELPGIRLVEPRTFDVTPEDAAGDVVLGEILDETDQPAGPVTVTLDALNRHTFVCGATGAGKSQTVRHLLGEASAAGIPWLVIEPAKAEYARMAGRIESLGVDVVVIRPGDPDMPPVGFNPLEPAPGFALQTHVDMLAALFLAAFEPHEPFPQILDTALVRCYEQAGWDLTLGEPVPDRLYARYPTLSDLQRAAAEVVADIGYGAELAADVSGFIKVRLDSLRLGTTGRFFDGAHRLNFATLRERCVVMEIEDVGDDTDKAFLMGAVLLRLTEVLRVAARHAGPQPRMTHLTVIEEAHRLLRKPTGGPANQAVETFANLLAEVRAYGEGLVIAEQIPSKLIPDVIKNTAIKVVHRLPADDDRALVGATMNLDDQQSRALVALRPGEAAFFTPGMDRPALIRVPDSTSLERLDAPLSHVRTLLDTSTHACPACDAQVCTLRVLRAAQRLLERHPILTVWAELGVLAHLAGQRFPVPRSRVLAEVSAGVDSRIVLECAVAEAVAKAVDGRRATLQRGCEPAALAAHCRGLLLGVMSGDDWDAMCAEHGEFGMLARPYQWLEPWAHLSMDLELGLDGDPHPSTAEWQHRIGRPIPGASRTEQLAVVEEWRAACRADVVERQSVTFGAEGELQRTLAALSGPSTSWTAQVTAVLMSFKDLEWPAAHLIDEES